MIELLPTAIKPGIYKHYKGKMYRVIGMALHSETLQIMVVYQPLYETPDIPEGTLWVRPADMFSETVEIEGRIMPRFMFIE